MHAAYPSIPYGEADIRRIRRRGWLYESAVSARLHEARAQLKGYLADPALSGETAVPHVGLAVVFHGWELAACEAVGDEGAIPPPTDRPPRREPNDPPGFHWSGMRRNYVSARLDEPQRLVAVEQEPTSRPALTASTGLSARTARR